MVFGVFVDNKSLEVLRWYWEKSVLASRIYSALERGGLEGSFLPIVIVGRSGWGKTSYAYYALKTGIIRMLCYNHGIFDLGRCVETLESKMGELCMCKYCEKPDFVDNEYRWAFYTGITDLERLIRDIPKLIIEDGVKRKVLFMDDLVTKSVFAMGGKWRRAYLAFREFTRIARLGSSVIIMTATSPTLIPDFMKHGSEYITVRKHGNSFVYARFAKITIPRDNGTYTNALSKMYEDIIPIKAIFGLPRWLENEINERKKQLARDLVSFALGGEVA
jgi:hypothetical protein